MKVIKKKNKKAFLLGAMALALALLTVLAILLNVFLVIPDASETKEPPEIIEGVEALYGNLAIAYPRVTEANITLINVIRPETDTRPGTEYILQRQESEEKDKDGNPVKGPFALFYYDSYGELQSYYPPITENDPSFDYEDIYAIVQDDSFGMIPKLTYLCTAIGTPYFEERIELPKDAEKREIALTRYGLTDDRLVKIRFAYTDDKGKTQYHTIKIGEPMITGLGYYFMVDDREYVYSVETNNYFDYAMADFTSFVQPILTAAGLDMDSAFEPYLATDFKHYKNTMYDNDGTKEDKWGNKIPADVVLDDSKVIVSAAVYKSLISLEKGKSDTGYSKTSEKYVPINLTATGNAEAVKRFKGALVGKLVGGFDKNIVITAHSFTNTLDLNPEAATPFAYEYTVSAIEAILTEGADLCEAGVTVGEANLIRVTYTAKCNGKAVSSYPMHGVIDLSSASIPDAARVALRAAKTGELDTPVTFSVDYTDGEAAVKAKIRLVITDVISIMNDKGEDVAVAKEGTTVTYRFYMECDGVRLEGDEIGSVKLSEKTRGTKLYELLLGRKMSVGLSLEFENYTQYSEAVANVVYYDISGINYFVTSEEVVSFRFQQASLRDPYYGESLYENTSTGKYAMYGLNATACESVLKAVGGITGNSATKSEGLLGIETVAIGITDELMKDYNLYDYTVYFELPRGIASVPYDEEEDIGDYLDSLDDYNYYGTLGFNLYISREYPDGTRYIASDMYDLIAKIDASKLEFLNYGFVDFYSRRSIILTDISNVAGLDVEFYMDDLFGSYKNDLLHEKVYSYNGRHWYLSELTDKQLAQATKVDGITVTVTPDGKCSDNELMKALLEKGGDSITLEEFYDNVWVEGDTLGTDVFKEFVQVIFYSYYEGYLTEEEQAAAKDAKLLMRMSLSLGKYAKGSDDYEDYSDYDYVYEFYRISDRQVMVKLYRQSRLDPTDIKDVVSDFYVSAFTFKRIVNAYSAILDKQILDDSKPYEW